MSLLFAYYVLSNSFETLSFVLMKFFFFEFLLRENQRVANFLCSFPILAFIFFFRLLFLEGDKLKQEKKKMDHFALMPIVFVWYDDKPIFIIIYMLFNYIRFIYSARAPIGSQIGRTIGSCFSWNFLARFSGSSSMSTTIW